MGGCWALHSFLSVGADTMNAVAVISPSSRTQQVGIVKCGVDDRVSSQLVFWHCDF